jgi:hypothetical protein
MGSWRAAVPTSMTVEPVFGNHENKGMRRFTLRGKRKVDIQWKLFMLVPTIEKIGKLWASMGAAT